MSRTIHDEILERLDGKECLEPCSADEIRIALNSFHDAGRAEKSLNVVRKIWSSIPGLGVCPVLEELYREENNHSFYEGYRDHIVHTLEVYLLGMDFLYSIPELRDKVFEDYDNKGVKKLWAATAIAHDQGYIMERANTVEIPHDIQSLLLNPLFDIQINSVSNANKKTLGTYAAGLGPVGTIKDMVTFEVSGEKIDILNTISSRLPTNLLGTGENDLEAFFDLRKIVDFKVWDHGITSMLLLQQFHRRLIAQLTSLIPNLERREFLKPDDRIEIEKLNEELKKAQSIIDEASVAIALHNIRKNFSAKEIDNFASRYNLRLNDFQLSLQKTPLAWFLVFCDTLQEWNRPCSHRSANRKKEIHSPKDISLKYDEENNFSFLTFKDEDKKLKEEGESQFWKKRLELVEVLNEQDVDKYLRKGPPNKYEILKSEIRRLKTEIAKQKKPKKKEKELKGENWYYMGDIDAGYTEKNLKQKIRMANGKYNEHEPVFVLYTGGTVGMVRENPDDPKSPIKTQKLENVLPNLKRIGEIKNDIHFWELKDPLDSSNIGDVEWLEIAKTIQKVYHYYQGFVILHGTDTMAYTASALSFIFVNLSKPVIITGAEKPISEPVSDAEPNIVHSIQIAAYKAMDKPCVPEVCIFFGSKLLRGNRTKKIHSLALQGFDSPNCEALGAVEDEIDINQKILITAGSGKKLIIDDKLYPGVAIFEIYPNNKQCHETLRFILGRDHTRGLILKTYGTGNAPTAPDEYLDIVKEAINNGKIIVNLTHCPKGQVQVRLFETNARLFEHGVINGGDLTVEAALCKLMWLLGPYKQRKLSLKQIETIKARMQINFAGELRYSAYNLRESDIQIERDLPFIGDEQPLQFFDNNAINHAYIRAQGIKVDGPPCEFELEFYYCFQAIEQTPSDPKQLDHLIDSIPRRWDGQKEGITFNLDATTVVKKIREKERDAYHSLAVVAKCKYNIVIKTLELAIFTENIRGVRSLKNHS